MGASRGLTRSRRAGPMAALVLGGLALGALAMAGCLGPEASPAGCTAKAVEFTWPEAGAFEAIRQPRAPWRWEATAPLPGLRLNLSVPPAWGDVTLQAVGHTLGNESAAQRSDILVGVSLQRGHVYGYAPPGTDLHTIGEAYGALAQALSQGNATAVAELRHDFIASAQSRRGADGTMYDVYYGDLPDASGLERHYRSLSLGAANAVAGPVAGSVRLTSGPWEYWFSTMSRTANRVDGGVETTVGADLAGFAHYAIVASDSVAADRASVLARADADLLGLGVAPPDPGVHLVYTRPQGC